MFRVLRAIALVSPTSAVRRTLALPVASRSKLLKLPRPPVYQALGPGNMSLALRIATQNYSWASIQQVLGTKILPVVEFSRIQHK